MNKDYVSETDLLNYTAPEITSLVTANAWNTLDDYHKIEAIYAYVQNKILFGYNVSDTLTATEVLKDGIGQCNTKATLLMALFRSVNIPCRLHAFYVSKSFQRGTTNFIIDFLAPSNILHTWVEVWYDEHWVALEGVITDLAYVRSIQAKYSNHTAPFQGYAIATKNLKDIEITWKGHPTYIQKEAIVQDIGIFTSPDELYAHYAQPMSFVSAFLYAHIGCHIMTRRVTRLRNSNAHTII